METSKIIVDATEFAQALAAAIAIAPTKDPLDVVQFRIVSDSLVISARSHTEAIAVEVSTYFLDVNYDRDSYFEITRAEAIALGAMKMRKEDPDDELRLGLLVHEAWIHRTDESGLGLGIRAVKVRRHGAVYESLLGDVPHALSEALAKPATECRPKMDGRQWALLGKVAKLLDLRLTVWSTSKEESQAVHTAVSGDRVAMLVLCPDLTPGAAGEKLPHPDAPELPLAFDDMDVKVTIQANPPKGLA